MFNIVPFFVDERYILEAELAKIKTRPEDFKVREILKKGFLKGKGYRIYSLWKRRLETEEVVKRIAKVSNVPVKLIGYGGLKDKNAVTVQFISVPERFKLKEVKEKNLKVKFEGFSGKGITPAAVEGNSFEIVVREPLRYPERIDVLETLGIPGYYGEQRFTPVRGGQFFVSYLASDDFEGALLYLFTPAGWESSRSRKAKRAFVAKRFKEAAQLFSGWRREVALFLDRCNDFKKALSFVPRKEIEFQFNVFQSYLFNKYLRFLINEKTGEKVVFKYKVGEMVFPLENIELPEKIPVFHPEDWTLYVPFLEDIGLELERLKEFSDFFHRFERETVVPVKGFKLQQISEGVVLRFTLPSGHYATNVVRFLFDAVRKKKIG